MKVEFSIELDFFITYIILLSIFAPTCGIAVGVLEALEALGALEVLETLEAFISYLLTPHS